MKLKKLIFVLLFFFSPNLYADSHWVVVGGNMFDHPNADKYESICVSGTSYDFKKASNQESVEKRDYSKYTIPGLENIRYSYAFGYMGMCQGDYDKEYETIHDQNHPSILRVKNKFYTERIKGDKMITRSELSEDRAKKLFNKNFSDTYSLRKTVWKLPRGETLVEECIKGKFSVGSEKMHGDSYSISLVSKNGESYFLRQAEMDANFECNCDLDGITNCANLTSVTDHDNDGVLELIFFKVHEEESCARLVVDKVTGDDSEKELKREFHQGICVDW